MSSIAEALMNIVEVVPVITDIGIFFFGIIGAFFTYRAWRQRQDEIHEKYFDRRVALFEVIEGALRAGAAPSGKYEEWWPHMAEARYKIEFLFGQDASKLHASALNLMIEYQEALEIDDDRERVEKARTARKELGKVSSRLLEEMRGKISLNQ